MRLLEAVAAVLAFTSSAQSELLLLPRGSVWRYYYNGPVPSSWNQPAFDDHDWPTGPAQIGWGEGDEQTVAIDDPGYAPTLYFRRSFVVPEPAPTTLTLRLLADDGAIIYINGQEVFRRHMPAGKPDFLTSATVNVVTNENTFWQFALQPYFVHTGTNSIAVELHQHAAGGDDASFDLELAANISAGPPIVELLNPTNGATVAPGGLVLIARASDPDGGVTQVGFYTNGVLLGISSNEVFSLTWSNPPPGRHVIFARAYDDIFATGDSEMVHVQLGESLAPARVLRGPYLQLGRTNGITVRWRTDWVSDSVVWFGTNAASLNLAVTNSFRTGEHAVALSGLDADTFYYYAVGSSAGELVSGEDFHFRTAPSTARPIRIWAIGDSGTANENAAAVRDAYYEATAGHETDVWLMLGDNAYGLGFDEEYQAAVFDMYAALLQNTVVWPALGNHDAQELLFGPADAYRRCFTLPQAGEAGGVPSGNPFYYSFDYGNIHFICLDSFLADRSTNGPMVQWLRIDLAATDKEWIIAYWHHPPYSWGDHDSDTDYFEIEMRQSVNPLLEEYGVDLVLSGHSHEYERSFLLNGHYGYSWDFEPRMALDATLGREDDQGAYRKAAGGMGSQRGTVYTVCGCSGAGGSLDFPLYPAMATNHGGWGSMVIEVNGLKLNASFLRPSGDIDDSFTIDKSAPVTNGPALKIARESNGVILEWPSSKPAFELQAANDIKAMNWTGLTNEVVNFGRRKQANVGVLRTNRFFRLRSED